MLLLDFVKNDFNILDNPFQVTLKANQKGDVTKTFESNVKFLRGKDGNTSGEVANDFTLKKKHECWNSKWKLDSGSVNFEKEFTPKDWRNDDHIFGVKFTGKSVPKDTSFSWTSEGRFGLLNLAKDFKFFGALGVTCGTDHQLPASASLIFQLLNNYKFGINFSKNLKSKELQPEKVNVTFTGQLNNDLFAFAKIDVFKRHLDLGGTYLVRDFIDKVAWNLSFDVAENNIANQQYSAVAEKKYNDDTTFKTKIDIKDRVFVSNVLTLKITNNLKAKLVDGIAPLDAWKSKTFGSYKYGASFDFEF